MSTARVTIKSNLFSNLCFITIMSDLSDEEVIADQILSVVRDYLYDSNGIEKMKKGIIEILQDFALAGIEEAYEKLVQKRKATTVSRRTYS